MMGPSWQSPQYSRREASPPATRPVWPAKVGAVSRVPWDLVEHLAEARQLRSSTDASSQGAPHHRTGLTDQRVITGATELGVIGAAFMRRIGQALVRIHVEHGLSSRPPLMHLSIRWAEKIAKGGTTSET